VPNTTSWRPDETDITAALEHLARITYDETWARGWEDAAELLARSPRADEHLFRHAPAVVDRLARMLDDVVCLARLPRRDERLSPSSYVLLDLLSSPVSNQYHVAWDLLSRWSDRSAWWSVRFAVKALLDVSPSAAVGVVDSWLGQLAAQRDLETTTRMVCVSTALEVVMRGLHGASTSVLALERALLDSRVPLIRGIANASLGRRLVDDPKSRIDDLLAGLNALEPGEHVVALCECVYRLRVRANRSGGESGRDAQTRLALFGELIRIWSSARPNLRDTVFRIEGPVAGGWSSSTTFDLLIPLVEHGDLSFDDVVRLWTQELRGRWAGTFDGNHYFYRDSDGPLTHLVATLLSQDGDAGRWFLDEVLVMASEARRVLDHPFSRSSSYDRWSHARDGLIWMKAFAQLLSTELRLRVEPLLAPVLVDSDDMGVDPSHLYRLRATSIDDPFRDAPW
jgi:hypothetical protein